MRARWVFSLYLGGVYHCAYRGSITRGSNTLTGG